MTQEPPRDPSRRPDPSDPAWVDHILDQLTSRPMPAAPEVAGAEADEPEPFDAVPEPAEGEDVEFESPAVEAPEVQAPLPPPPAAPDELPMISGPGLLDELLSLDLDSTAGPADDPEPQPEPPPPEVPEAPAEQAAPPPPPEVPEAPEVQAPSPPPPAAAAPPAPRPPAGVPRPVPPRPAQVPPPIPPPPRRGAPRGTPVPARGHGDPMLAGPPPSPAPAPPRPRRRRALEPPEEPRDPTYDGVYDEDYTAEFDEHLVESHSRWRTAVGWALTVAIAVVLSLVIRSFVAHAFHVESGSMEPTLAPGDRILVNKLASNPSRGDLVVFSRPDGDLVKRVIALEGETLYFEDGLLKIDESWLVEPYLSAGTGTYVRAAIPNCDPTEGFGRNEACTVPEDHVFVLGDNRSVSFDSRNFGPVPRENLVGNAALQFWPLGDLRSL
ncbi:MAG: signal peptidase I [bacterium]|nr:signal peptidase I [bacterium]